jgi:hypothetical protein
MMIVHMTSTYSMIALEKIKNLIGCHPHLENSALI